MATVTDQSLMQQIVSANCQLLSKRVNYASTNRILGTSKTQVQQRVNATNKSSRAILRPCPWNKALENRTAIDVIACSGALQFNRVATCTSVCFSVNKGRGMMACCFICRLYVFISIMIMAKVYKNIYNRTSCNTCAGDLYGFEDEMDCNWNSSTISMMYHTNKIIFHTNGEKTRREVYIY